MKPDSLAVKDKVVMIPCTTSAHARATGIKHITGQTLTRIVSDAINQYAERQGGQFVRQPQGKPAT